MQLSAAAQWGRSGNPAPGSAQHLTELASCYSLTYILVRTSNICGVIGSDPSCFQDIACKTWPEPAVSAALQETEHMVAVQVKEQETLPACSNFNMTGLTPMIKEVAAVQHLQQHGTQNPPRLTFLNILLHGDEQDEQRCMSLTQ